MTIAPVYDGTVTNTYERTAGPGTAHAHIENPDWPGHALCLAKLTGPRTGHGDCPECVRRIHLNRAWIAR